MQALWRRRSLAFPRSRISCSLGPLLGATSQSVSIFLYLPLLYLIKLPYEAGTLNPAPSEPIGGGGALAMSSIETSLTVLKEASSLAVKIPCISPIAGLLLQAITMRGVSVPSLFKSSSGLTNQQEVKLYKAEWDVVMRKLIRVAGRVVYVGELCKKYDLEERDLPPSLREILQSLQTCVNPSR